VKPLRWRLIPAVVLAFVVIALSANLAAANEGGESGRDVVPYDPGLPGDVLPPLPPLPWSFE
jgi:hypothetical protein